ncbi:MAG: hypothetical protein K2V38_28115, partial [Gemmataceae bacterium]|nr:hypothetical protein [Gemmataceae bacterium]
ATVTVLGEPVAPGESARWGVLVEVEPTPEPRNAAGFAPGFFGWLAPEAEEPADPAPPVFPWRRRR